MQQAADAVALAAVDMLADEHSMVLVVVGPGNNGGDGMFAAARLASRGHDVRVWYVMDRHHEAGANAARSAGVTEVDAIGAVELLAECDLVIDAVFGIGARPGLEGPVAEFAAACEAVGVPVLSVDLPSGLGADQNTVAESAFRAHRTVTFIARKMCHVAEPARSMCGDVELADLGVETSHEGIHVLEVTDLARMWPFPKRTADKYSRGVVGMDTGSESFPGAGVLGTLGAVYSGAGMVRFVGSDKSAAILRALVPSVTFGRGKVQSWVAGSGWGLRADGQERLQALLAVGAPSVIDADALTQLPEHVGGSLLTPHAGELAKLLRIEREDVEADPIGSAGRAAVKTGASVLLKGATQYSVRPDGDVLIAISGPAWTGQAGSGDVLAGICGTLLAGGLEPHEAGAVAASVQALAATNKPGPYPPDVIAQELPVVISHLEQLADGARRTSGR